MFKINCKENIKFYAIPFLVMLLFTIFLHTDQSYAGGRSGECGLAHGTEFGTAPTDKSALCARGVSSTVTVNASNKWVWSCSGSDGINASCQADNCGTPPPASPNCGGSYKFYSSSPSTAQNDMTCTSATAPRAWDKGTSSSHSSAAWLNEGQLIDTTYKTAQCVSHSSCAPPPGSCTYGGNTYADGAKISQTQYMCGNGEMYLGVKRCCNGTPRDLVLEDCGNYLGQTCP